jgi:hypothetical protein
MLNEIEQVQRNAQLLYSEAEVEAAIDVMDRLKTNPERRHKVKGRTSFAFSDVRNGGL